MGETNSSVFGPQFCGPHPVDLTIFGTGGIFTVSNAATDHAVKFRAVKIDSGLRQIWDAAGNPIATLRRKSWSAHERWEVFRGESKKKEDKVFSLASPSIFNFKLNYHVFLAANQQDHDEDCDFKINGKWKKKKKTLSIYAAKSPTNNIISRVEQKQKAKNWDELEVKVEANMDQALICSGCDYDCCCYLRSRSECRSRSRSSSSFKCCRCWSSSGGNSFLGING